MPERDQMLDEAPRAGGAVAEYDIALDPGIVRSMRTRAPRTARAASADFVRRR
jgi:hypothetical protein